MTRYSLRSAPLTYMPSTISWVYLDAVPLAWYQYSRNDRCKNWSACFPPDTVQELVFFVNEFNRNRGNFNVADQEWPFGISTHILAVVQLRWWPLKPIRFYFRTCPLTIVFLSHFFSDTSWAQQRKWQRQWNHFRSCFCTSGNTPPKKLAKHDMAPYDGKMIICPHAESI